MAGGRLSTFEIKQLMDEITKNACIAHKFYWFLRILPHFSYLDAHAPPVPVPIFIFFSLLHFFHWQIFVDVDGFFFHFSYWRPIFPLRLQIGTFHYLVRWPISI